MTGLEADQLVVRGDRYKRDVRENIAMRAFNRKVLLAAVDHRSILVDFNAHIVFPRLFLGVGNGL